MKFVRSVFMTLALLTPLTPLTAASAALANSQTGIASWYQAGTRTASGEAYKPDGMTAAHRSLPFGTIVKVENLSNGRIVHLRINDRGPFVGGRIIDVSRGGARQLGLMGRGTARVRVTALRHGTGGRSTGSRGGYGFRSSRNSSDLKCIISICL